LRRTRHRRASNSSERQTELRRNEKKSERETEPEVIGVFCGADFA